MPSVTIVVCTRDRAESLRETLAALGRCQVPPDLTVSLLVVDNGSTDGTAAVVRAAALSNLPVRYLAEPRPGLSHARNAALRATRDDVLLFTDDDVRPSPGWIEGMCRPILDGMADAVAGEVHFPPAYEPLFAREPFRTRRGWFACTQDLDANQPGQLVGANMALGRRALDAVGEFDPELGAGALGFHEETLWSARLLAAGLRLVKGPPAASVEHHFDRTRLNRNTLLNMSTRMGRSTAWLDHHWHGHAERVSAWEVWRTRALLRLERTLPPWRSRREESLSREMERVHNLAYLEELGRLRGQPRKYPHAPRAG